MNLLPMNFNKCDSFITQRQLRFLFFDGTNINSSYEFFNSVDEGFKAFESIDRGRFSTFFSITNPEGLRRECAVKNFCKRKTVKELTLFFLKLDVWSWLTSPKKTKISFKEHKVYPLYIVSLPGHTWQCDSKNTDSKLQNIKTKIKIF